MAMGKRKRQVACSRLFAWACGAARMLAGGGRMFNRKLTWPTAIGIVILLAAAPWAAQVLLMASALNALAMKAGLPTKPILGYTGAVLLGFALPAVIVASCLLFNRVRSRVGRLALLFTASLGTAGLAYIGVWLLALGFPRVP